MSTFLAMLLAMVAGFVAGWAAHRSDSRAYIESRERYWADQLAAELRACQQELAHAEAAQSPTAPAPEVIHVHLSALPGGWPLTWPQPSVIDALPASQTPGREIGR